MPTIPFGEWLPDKSVFNSPGASDAEGVYPRTEMTY